MFFSHRADVWSLPYGSKEGRKQLEAELKVAYPGIYVDKARLLHMLRRLGDDGWELVATKGDISDCMLFKRPLE